CAAAGDAGLGSLPAVLVHDDEALEAGVVHGVEPQLAGPGGGDDRLPVAEPGEGGGDHLVVVGGEGPDGGDVAGRQVGGVGQPDGAVLEVVDEVLLGERGVVEAAVGPHRVVGPARRRVDRVLDVSPDVLGGLDAEGLHPVEALAGLADRHHLHPQRRAAGTGGVGGGVPVAPVVAPAGGEERAGGDDR